MNAVALICRLSLILFERFVRVLFRAVHCGADIGSLVGPLVAAQVPCELARLVLEMDVAIV